MAYTQYHVDPTGGSNSDNGTSFAQAWLTLSYALSQVAGAGVEILLYSGTFQEQVVIDVGGSVSEPLKITVVAGQTVIFDGNNYTLPTGTDIAGGVWVDQVGNSHTYYDSNYKGLFHIKASNVVVDGGALGALTVEHSRGEGLIAEHVDAITGSRYSNITIKYAICQHCRRSPFRIHGVDNGLFEHIRVTDGGNYAPFDRPSGAGAPFNHPGCCPFKFGTTHTMRDVWVYNNWGEGFILHVNLRQWLAEDIWCWDNFSGNIYFNHCGPGTLRRFVAFNSDINQPSATDFSSGLWFNNETLQAPQGANPDNINNVTIENGVIVNCQNSVFIASGDHGLHPYTNVYIRHVAAINPKHKAFKNGSSNLYIHGQANIVNCKVENCLFHIGANPAWVGVYDMDQVAAGSAANITLRNNFWSSAPPSAFLGTGGGVGALLLANPDVDISGGNITITNYKQQATSPLVSGGVNVGTTHDIVSTARPAAPAAPDVGAFQFTGGGGGGGGGTTADVIQGVAQGILPQTIATTSFTDTNAGGTPNGTIFFANKAASISGGVATAAHANWGIGFYDGTNVASYAVRSRDAQAATDAREKGSLTKAIFLMNDAATSNMMETTGGGFINNGVQLTTAVAPGADSNILAWLWGGTDVACKVGSFSFASGDTTNTVSSLGLGGVPNFIMTISSAQLFDDSPAAGHSYSIGVAVSVANQFYLARATTGGASPSAVLTKMRSGYINENLSNGQTHAFTTIDSDTFTVTRAGATGVRRFIYFAAYVQNASVFLGNPTIPITTGVTSYTTGFESKLFFMLSSLIQSLNTSVTDADANSFAVSLLTANVEYSMSYCEEDNQTTTDTESTYADDAIKMRSVVGTDIAVGTKNAFTSTAVPINYTTVPATTARQALAFAIQATTTASVTADFDATPLTGEAPELITFDDDSTAVNTTITTWNWNFGDGGTSTSQHPTHNYLVGGTYNVTLTVSDGTLNDTKVRSGYIVLTDPPPTPPAAATLTRIKAGAVGHMLTGGVRKAGAG